MLRSVAVWCGRKPICRYVPRASLCLNAPARQGNLESLSGAVTVIARQGDIALEGRVTGVRMTGGDPDSRGGTTLIAARDIRLLSENADRLAIAFASDGDLVAEAGRSIVNRNGRLLSNAQTDLRATVELDNRTDRLDDASAMTQVVRGRRTWFSFLFGRPRTTITTQRFSPACGFPANRRVSQAPPSSSSPRISAIPVTSSRLTGRW